MHQLALFFDFVPKIDNLALQFWIVYSHPPMLGPARGAHACKKLACVERHQNSHIYGYVTKLFLEPSAETCFLCKRIKKKKKKKKKQFSEKN